ncbi:unnamed protein product [Parnassius apollo]|uniref:(apollo) hypothetical protein n=1 Tax=Parnassius apollo TaxID=110799 RepID=A0A8S3XRA7_PARAO|nr:unnamed protein product [Parnassius apollo]
MFGRTSEIPPRSRRRRGREACEHVSAGTVESPRPEGRAGERANERANDPARCPRCRCTVDASERAARLLACSHTLCSACARALSASGELRCPLCWTRTAGDAACASCWSHAQALPLRAELRRLAARRRDFLLRALDAATALKLRLEAELTASADLAERASPPPAELERLRACRAEALMQCRFDDLVRSAAVPLDFEILRRALSDLSAADSPPPVVTPDPVLFLANYCTTQLYLQYLTRHKFSPSTTLTRIPHAFPLFYFNLEVNGLPFGRVVIEVRSDLAPRMARNFKVLATGELGVGYRGCTVFQCWENESVITGDYELNNGRGGRSAFEESYFMPDDTKMAAVRGSVGMRRSQKRHDNLGLVGSQFRIVLREMRGFTAIFAFVVEGLEIVDRLSRTGDSSGKPQSTILIASCGKLN